MLGDVADIVRRLRSVLPNGWFGQEATITDSVLSAFGTAWSWIYQLVGQVIAASRIATATGPFLDMISVDFFGAALPRALWEADQAFIARIRNELLRNRGTRAALDTALSQLTGRYPVIVEPARPADVGGYSTGGSGYCVAGAWGSLMLDHACFVTAFRPLEGGIAQIAGFGTGGPIVYGNLDMVTETVNDAQILARVASVLPLGCTAWTRIKNQSSA